MSFLDRFKTTPKYRNPDPAVRLAGIAELPDDAESWGVIAELAASDEDVRVRRAAVERLGAVGYLARIARTERDESLRRDIADRLVAIANSAGEPLTPTRRRPSKASATRSISVRSPSPRRTRQSGRRHSARFRTRRCWRASPGMPSRPRSRWRR